MDTLLTTALDAGLGAVALIALVLLALRQQKDHKGERTEWKDASAQQFNRIADLTEKSTEVSAQQTVALQSLQEVVKSCHKK